MRIAHARFLSDRPHCPMATSKSVCLRTVPDIGAEGVMSYMVIAFIELSFLYQTFIPFQGYRASNGWNTKLQISASSGPINLKLRVLVKVTDWNAFLTVACSQRRYLTHSLARSKPFCVVQTMSHTAGSLMFGLERYDQVRWEKKPWMWSLSFDFLYIICLACW